MKHIATNKKIYVLLVFVFTVLFCVKINLSLARAYEQNASHSSESLPTQTLNPTIHPDSDATASHSSNAEPTSSQTSFPTSVCKPVPTGTGSVTTIVTL